MNIKLPSGETFDVSTPSNTASLPLGKQFEFHDGRSYYQAIEEVVKALGGNYTSDLHKTVLYFNENGVETSESYDWNGSISINDMVAAGLYNLQTETWTKNITKAEIGTSVSAIDNKAFYGCGDLSDVSILDSVKRIGVEAFRECSSLKSINIPRSVQQIEYGAFFNCGLKTVSIPDSITVIEQSAFDSCYSLTSIDLPDGLERIKEYAFLNCSSLLSVDIPDSVRYIEAYAFQSCDGLREISIPSSIESIEECAFYECHNLTTIRNFPSDLSSILDLKSLYGDLNVPYVEQVFIADGSTRINSNMFATCENLSSVSIPDSVTAIGDSAFYMCGISSLTIPSSVTSIGSNAFDSCHSLTELTVLGDNIVLGDRMCYLTGLTTVTFVGKVASTKEKMFLGSPVVNLTFQKNTKAEVQDLEGYPWGIAQGVVIGCSDGYLVSPGSGGSGSGAGS